MLKLLFSTVFAAALVWFAPAQQPAQKPREADQKLWIDAAFVDGKGNPVTDLKKDEIEVWIGHFLAPMEDFVSVTPENDAGRGGRVMVLLLDDVMVPTPDTARVREAARHFVDRMAEGDRLAVVTLNGEGMELTGDRARLRQAIDHYNVRATGVWRADTLGEHVLSTLAGLAGKLAEAGDQRKTIVAIGRGDVFDRPLPPPNAGHDLLPEWVQAMRVMALSNTALYVLDSATLGARRLADNGETGLAKATGGHALIGINDLNGAADRILREAASYYLIGLKPPPVGRQADLRELEIKVKRRGITVHAREAVSGGR
jgi:VWFA-related protein